MEKLYKKVSYLKGLADGMKIKDESKEGELIHHIIETLEDLTCSINEVSENHGDLEEYVSFIDEDLAEIEEDYYSYEDFDDSYDFADLDCCNDEDMDEEE